MVSFTSGIFAYYIEIFFFVLQLFCFISLAVWYIQKHFILRKTGCDNQKSGKNCSFSSNIMNTDRKRERKRERYWERWREREIKTSFHFFRPNAFRCYSVYFCIQFCLFANVCVCVFYYCIAIFFSDFVLFCLKWCLVSSIHSILIFAQMEFIKWVLVCSIYTHSAQ